MKPSATGPASFGAAAAPVVPYWHLWVDSEGVSHQQRRELRDFRLSSIAPPAAAQWLAPAHSGAMSVLFTVLPPGWMGTWHENPRPQWIVPLSGRWFVEAMDGTRAEMGPGEIAFGADQGCRARGERCGHRSGTVGQEAAVLMLVQLQDAAARAGAPAPPPPKGR
jgi:hypothetical protein